ncbi:MAG: 2TM domain-containing protein [Prevotellaceae bacterium]|jgi:hypothetical protein|nr:2TM domain-containing protein [Prevotellaceae bacterium]
MEQFNNNEDRLKAERRVEELRKFYSHLLTYCVVNAGIFLINCLASPHHLWFFWPLFGWGIGVACHGLSLCRHGLWGEAWKERKIRELMKKENNRK